MEDGLGKKRSRDTPAFEEEMGEDGKKNRGSYRCSRCNLPKKGHVCPYQPRLKKKDLPPDAMRDASVQVEMDRDMVVRSLQLDKQGLPESYMVVKTAINESAPVRGAGGRGGGRGAGRWDH